jgi:hypothetical protein
MEEDEEDEVDEVERVEEEDGGKGEEETGGDNDKSFII